MYLNSAFLLPLVEWKVRNQVGEGGISSGLEWLLIQMLTWKSACQRGAMWSAEGRGGCDWGKQGRPPRCWVGLNKGLSQNCQRVGHHCKRKEQTHFYAFLPVPLLPRVLYLPKGLKTYWQTVAHGHFRPAACVCALVGSLAENVCSSECRCREGSLRCVSRPLLGLLLYILLERFFRNCFQILWHICLKVFRGGKFWILQMDLVIVQVTEKSTYSSIH